eukprot:CAMPEP_0197832592 /NCGR_PEP_ID=MMETSP1437-20131217/15290_1 /TAXON_ID=49252 ORGANISM="Eucampia antarctica, Strain CCMP1452" /NCGR_SAMPLE_ID=MMETSP1437 /ASSEMBLY_ACC=CAM_ASM_001096 /LENGTH=561 /DNA_ID=CAMNT_0043436037 /DNA_START=92 /DNA_END=1777 /DNA_ORIENTATION=+
MTSITSATKHSVKKTKTGTGKKLNPPIARRSGASGVAKSRSGGAGTTSRRGRAPKLVATLSSSDVSNMSKEEVEQTVQDLLRQAMGESTALFKQGIAKPRTSSSTASRSSAAADIATLAVHHGLLFVLKQCGVLEKVESQLIPMGIGAVFGNERGNNPGGGMRKIASSASLTSMTSTVISDTKKGKTIPPEAREGSLLLLRALAEIVGTTSEPFVVPTLAAALDESASSHSYLREAATDTATAIIELSNPHALPGLICPVLFEAFHSPEWRVKENALDRMKQCASHAPRQMSVLLPQIIPTITTQIWDTKPQVGKAASSAILAACQTNLNPDVAPAIPAVVLAICKPKETVRAIDELKATTFVATVDASTLAILCPILSRGLKERLAINKRSCCIVIDNMSKLVDSPDAVAPFGPLLVPELKKVADNVQFEEIRDAALAALQSLTKALGHSSIDEAIASVMAEEASRVQQEQSRIEEERLEQERAAKEIEDKEAEERRLWKEVMDAQRQLDKLALQEQEEKKAEEVRRKEMAKKSTKSSEGKCQSCGLKKCRKTCLFFKEK